MNYIVYDRYFAQDQTSGQLKTFWRVIGTKYNSAVELNEMYPVPTLNCFAQNIASLFVFCKPTQLAEFEKRILMDIHKTYGNNLRIFKFNRKLTVSATTVTLSSNLDNIQNIFMMHTRSQTLYSNINNKEPISSRFVYKMCFNLEKTRTEIVERLRIYELMKYPDLEMFIPFDDECELLLNHIFPTSNRHQDSTRYTYMTVVSDHYMDIVPSIESFHNLVQLISSRTPPASDRIVVDNRQPMVNPQKATAIFLENVPIVDIILGRVYENEQCLEFDGSENEITFIIIKIFIFKRTEYVIFLNRKFQNVSDLTRLPRNVRLNNILMCDDEREILIRFYNLYTNGLIFKIFNMDIHFIMATQRYKSQSYILMHRIIHNRLWSEFSTHTIISEDGKCIRFNRNTIILFDNIDHCSSIITNQRLINKDIFLPELYNDSTIPIDADMANHLQNIKQTKQSKYTNIPDNRPLTSMSLYDLIICIFEEEEQPNNLNNYSNILESIIELSNKIRIPITLLYSLSVAQIAYRLIFYTSLRNGVFLIMDRDQHSPNFYKSETPDTIKDVLAKLKPPQKIKIFQPSMVVNMIGSDLNPSQQVFQNLVKRFIPMDMTGNLMENYFMYFTPHCQTGRHQFPVITSLVTNESELLSSQNSIIWANPRLVHKHSIASLDFSLYFSSIMATFGMDFQNCVILYGVELKNFFRSIFPTPSDFHENNIELLRLPHTFIMDNDTLKIINIVEYSDIHQLNDTAQYVVIMRFITDRMMQSMDEKYKSLSQLFYDNIIDLQKYRTRLMLHKNILNSICGMLSTYNINTTLLHIVNALSRKIMLWVVTNCLSESPHYGEEFVSFINHEYDPNIRPPENLISIQTDSFTFIYDYATLNYDRMKENEEVVNGLKEKIIDKLCTQLRQCTTLNIEELQKMFRLRINFITGNIFQMSTRRYYYIQNGRLECGDRNNRIIQKALYYINIEKPFIDSLVKNKPIKLSYLKRTYAWPELRRFFLWYMFQNSQLPDNGNIHDRQKSNLERLRDINIFVELEENKVQKKNRKPKTTNLNILFNVVSSENIEDIFMGILASPNVNFHFQSQSIPDLKIYDTSFRIPTEKAAIVKNCLTLFFKLYNIY